MATEIPSPRGNNWTHSTTNGLSSWTWSSKMGPYYKVQEKEDGLYHVTASEREWHSFEFKPALPTPRKAFAVASQHYADDLEQLLPDRGWTRIASSQNLTESIRQVEAAISLLTKTAGRGGVYDRAIVEDTAKVSGGAMVMGDAHISDNASISQGAQVGHECKVSGNASVSGRARITQSVEISENARVSGNVEISGQCQIFGKAKISGDVRLSGNVQVYGQARVEGSGFLGGNAEVSGKARIMDRSTVSDFAEVSGDAVIMGSSDIRGKAVILGGVWEDITITEGRWLAPGVPA